jgi:HK97 gp10 family phage protein
MSVSVNIEVAGGEEFAAAMNRFDTAIKSQVQAYLLEWAEVVKADSERLVPVRTGYLQSTIFANSQDWQVEVGAEASYASAVEFGTQYAKAQPFIAPAVEAYLPNLEHVLLNALDSAKAEAQL